MIIKTITGTITENRANGKVVQKSEHVSSTKVSIIYTDGSKTEMSSADFKTMHRVVEK